jgi:hypothetical protein
MNIGAQKVPDIGSSEGERRAREALPTQLLSL